MNREGFWKLIEDSGSGGDIGNQAEALASELATRSAEETRSFDEHLSGLQAEAYSNALWGAAYVINGGCSDDTFDYFRTWLVAQGRTVFASAVADPDSLALLPKMEEDSANGEEIMSVAYDVHEALTGKKLPPPETPISLPYLGTSWNFEDQNEMKRRYPKLYETYWGEWD